MLWQNHYRSAKEAPMLFLVNKFKKSSFGALWCMIMGKGMKLVAQLDYGAGLAGGRKATENKRLNSIDSRASMWCQASRLTL